IHQRNCERNHAHGAPPQLPVVGPERFPVKQCPPQNPHVARAVHALHVSEVEHGSVRASGTDPPSVPTGTSVGTIASVPVSPLESSLASVLVSAPASVPASVP